VGFVERFNAHVRTVARSSGCRLVDLENAAMTPDDFYDDIHYSVAGSRRVGALVGAELSRIVNERTVGAAVSQFTRFVEPDR
jgi:hypothetical protein